ncbi:uncharacterized protein [Euwallacea similis]|uniref:uncharacterized protein n=1 Tax=Euwallacea similis TaxID=1736056 RepID=UPI00344FE629
MQKHSLSNDESSEALGGLPAREMNDVTTNKADIKLKKSKVKLNAKSLEKSFTKKEKRKSPTQNPIGGHQESHPTTDATKEVTPVRSAEVTKATRLESIGGTKHSSNLQTVTSVEENQESKPSTDSRQKTRKQRNFTKTPTPLDEAETSSSKEIKSSSEALQGVSLPLVKSESPVARKSNFSTQKKLEKSNATFVCTLCDCNFKLKGDVMIHCIMRHHCEAPESSLLPVKTKKSSMGSGKNLLDAALKTNEGYVECENRGAKMGDLPVKKLKQKKVVTLQQYKENKTLFNSKYDSDSSGSSTSQETFKSNSFKTGTTQGKAKKVLTLQQYKAMKSSKLKFSCDNDYSSSPTGTIVGLEENLNQSALQDTKIATFSDEPDSEKDCMQRDSPSYCEVCGLQIDNSSSRAHHMEFVHPGFALKCFVCGTSCGNFDSLIKHQRRHSEFQILIGENQFLKTRKSGPNQSYPYYCTFCGTGFTLVKMFLAHKLSLQCRKKKTGELARNDVAGERDGGGKNDVAGIPEEVEKSNVPNILNEVEKDNIAGDLDEVEEDDLSDDPQLKIDEEAGETDADSEQKTIADAAEAGASSSHRNHHT